MRTQTTTNSAPLAAVTLSKQRPRPSLRMIHITPIKSLREPWALTEGIGTPACRSGSVKRRAHTHTCSAWAHSQLLPSLSAKPVFTFTNPHLNRTVILQTVCSRKAHTYSHVIIITLDLTSSLILRFFKNTFPCMQNAKKKKKKCGNGFLCFAYIL